MTETTTPEFYGILTDAGEKLQFDCLNNPDTTFEMLEMAVGDGNGSYYEPEKSQSKLKNECYRHAITRRMTDEENRVKSVILDIPEDITGFTIREVGVFGVNGELLIIGKYPETPKLDTSSGAISQLAIKVDLTQVNELVLPVLIDPSVNTASVEYVEKYFQKLEEKGQPNGYASLDESGLVPREQLPLTDYVKGCVNSGSVDENGEPNLMSYEAETQTVTVKSPFVYTTVSGKTYECTNDLSVVLDETLTGNVRIWVDKDEDEDAFSLKAMSNNIFIQKFEPKEAAENDVWINTSVAPETQQIKTSTGWEIFEGVEIGSLQGFSVGGGVTLRMNKYNLLRHIEELENTKADKSEIDGKWVSKPLTLLASATVKNNKTFDLSSYLPQDGNIYEVVVSGVIRPPKGQVISCNPIIKSDVMGSALYRFCSSQNYNTTIQNVASGTVIIPCKQQITLNFGLDTTNFNTIDILSLAGYRKVR